MPVQHKRDRQCEHQHTSMKQTGADSLVVAEQGSCRSRALLSAAQQFRLNPLTSLCMPAWGTKAG